MNPIQHMKNDADHVIRVDLKQVKLFEDQGYKACEAPAPKLLVPVKVGPADPAPGLTRLWKGKDHLDCNPAQQAAFEKGGWSNKKPSDNAPTQNEIDAEAAKVAAAESKLKEETDAAEAAQANEDAAQAQVTAAAAAKVTENVDANSAAAGNAKTEATEAKATNHGSRKANGSSK